METDGVIESEDENVPVYTFKLNEGNKTQMWRFEQFDSKMNIWYIVSAVTYGKPIVLTVFEWGFENNILLVKPKKKSKTTDFEQLFWMNMSENPMKFHNSKNTSLVMDLLDLKRERLINLRERSIDKLKKTIYIFRI